jgi:hypothetical protein
VATGARQPTHLNSIPTRTTHFFTVKSPIYASLFPVTSSLQVIRQKLLYSFIGCMRAKSPVNLTVFHPNALSLSGEKYKLRSSSLCNPFQPLPPSLPLRSTCFPQHNVITHFQSVVPSGVRHQVSHPCKSRCEIHTFL